MPGKGDLMADEEKKPEKPAAGKESGKPAGGGGGPQEGVKRNHAGTLTESETEKRREADESSRLSKGLCVASGCTGSAIKYHFCVKHFEAFSLGLITKHGLPAKDYEKKMRAIIQKKKLNC